MTPLLNFVQTVLWCCTISSTSIRPAHLSIILTQTTPVSLIHLVSGQ